MSAIFYHSDEQRKLALETKALQEERRNKKIQTEIVPFSKFYLAEDYHQKYYLSGQTDLMREFQAVYPGNIDVVHSTAAARVNGYVGGHGTLEEVQAVIESLGLSPSSQERLLAPIGGQALISINKALITRASAVIPAVPLYIALLYRVMKAKKLHEGCIQQMYRLFHDFLFGANSAETDAESRIRLDDWEMRADVQNEIRALWQ